MTPARPQTSNGTGPRTRRPTATAEFGSGRRESHDARAFYDRFISPEISDDDTVNPPGQIDVIHHHDARSMTMVPDNSVALVVTSPPYFAGKQYEQSLGHNGVPATYFEYLELLYDVFAECRRVLEPGGRIAVNVANLGRRPYRSLSGDVTAILQDLGLLLRGEVIWWKGRAAGGSCAWGTFQRPSNPVLRDVTERIVIASKGRFDRAQDPRRRQQAGLPSTITISRDEFMEATTDLWELPTESATRVGHPAPFPVELPQRLIDLYTYGGDVVLDPFMGSGSSALAAVRSGRHYIGFDTDASYIDLANSRLAREGDPSTPTSAASGSRIEAPIRRDGSRLVEVDPLGELAGLQADTNGSPVDVATAIRAGLQVRDIARIMVEQAGFTQVTAKARPRGTGVEVDLVASDVHDNQWAFLVSGGLTTSRNGLRRSDVLWRSLGQAAVLHSATELSVVLLTTDLPAGSTPGAKALKQSSGVDGPVSAVVDMTAPDATDVLAALAGTTEPTDRASV
ncbi:MAG: site-specific DNA-methyltransferase [Microthrixaceae bacterium]|nr:site-specific DNA-methyltransferase [Microthrixaceae bacterium]